MDFTKENLIKAMETNDIEFINEWKKRFNIHDSFLEDLIPVVQQRKELDVQIDFLAKLIQNLESGEITPDKIAWHKYVEYCLEQLDKFPADSAGHRYYQGEVAKAKSEIDRL